MEDALKDIQDARKEADQYYGQFLTSAERDQKIALGDQWADGDKEKLSKENRPILSLNLIGKGCRMISAQQRQNPMDLQFYPVDSSDQEGADVYTAVNKWLFTNGQYAMNRSLAFDDTIQTGIGWLAPEMCYDYDPLYGDIVLNHESIYSIMPDPYLTKMTLEDCDYMIRQKYLSKMKVKSLYSDFAKDIEDLEGGKTTSEYKTLITKSDKLFVTERWYRDYEETTVLIDPNTLNSMVWEGTEGELVARMAIDESMRQLSVVTRSMPVMKLQIGINDELLVYDGDVPDGYSRYRYPFIPLWGFFTPHYNEQEWNLRLFGYARGLIDSQIEKNKTRSLLMDGIMRSLRGKLFMEEGAVQNPEDFNSTDKNIIKVNPGGWEKWKEYAPQMIDTALVQLEQLHTQDIKEEGLNPDLLQVEGGSAASAPTSSLQLRREQGMMSVQQLFDNLGLANRMLGLYNIDLINMWPAAKIEKIIGKKLPQDWDVRKLNTKYDCVVDEKASSPTYRQSVYNQILGLMQHGSIQGGIPPQVAMQIVDIPADVRQIWNQSNQQAQQQAQQAQQAQMKIQQQQITIGLEIEKLKQQGETMRLQMEEQGKMKRQEMEDMVDLAIAKLKNKFKK